VYVCLCRAVSDRKVRRSIRHGARTVEDIGLACGAGTGCGGCRPELEALLRDQRTDEDDVVTVGGDPTGGARLRALTHR
jgi:bacterioferritin-associated ferredoxin